MKDAASLSAAPVRLVVTDDHPVVLQGLQALFATSPELTVVAACATGEQTLAAVRAHRPDVLVLDLRMRGLDGRPASIVRCTRIHLPMDCALL